LSANAGNYDQPEKDYCLYYPHRDFRLSNAGLFWLNAPQHRLHNDMKEL